MMILEFDWLPVRLFPPFFLGRAKKATAYHLWQNDGTVWAWGDDTYGQLGRVDYGYGPATASIEIKSSSMLLLIVPVISGGNR